MTKRNKLLERIYTIPNDLRWEELASFLNHLGYNEISSKGKTGGSRVKFMNDKKDIISLHKPHPENRVKRYVLQQILKKLDKWKTT